jgi:hypothetical protein
MNNPDHISASLETIFWVKILKFFDVDPGSGIFLTLNPGSGLEKIRIRDKHPGSATLAVGTAGRKESFHVMCAINLVMRADGFFTTRFLQT